MIRVMIAEDSPHIQDSLCSLIDTQTDIQLVGTAKDGVEAVDMAPGLLPDVIIMDAQMPGLDGVEATKLIKRDFPSIGILFFSVFPDYVEASVTAGSDGYLTKDCGPAALFAEIRRIASHAGPPS